MRENKHFFNFRCCTKCWVQLFLQFDGSRENSCGADLFPQQQLCTDVFLLFLQRWRRPSGRLQKLCCKGLPRDRRSPVKPVSWKIPLSRQTVWSRWKWKASPLRVFILQVSWGVDGDGKQMASTANSNPVSSQASLKMFVILTLGLTGFPDPFPVPPWICLPVFLLSFCETLKVSEALWGVLPAGGTLKEKPSAEREKGDFCPCAAEGGLFSSKPLLTERSGVVHLRSLDFLFRSFLKFWGSLQSQQSPPSHHRQQFWFLQHMSVTEEFVCSAETQSRSEAFVPDGVSVCAQSLQSRWLSWTRPCPTAPNRLQTPFKINKN